MYGQYSTIGRVDCDGKLFHNNNDLKQVYHDDKLEYLRRYRFNLTPENTNHKDYVTEKLFEAIASGCIPIFRNKYYLIFTSYSLRKPHGMTPTNIGERDIINSMVKTFIILEKFGFHSMVLSR